MSENISTEEVLSVIGDQKWSLIIFGIILIVFLAAFSHTMKKRSVKSKERLHQELSEYMKIGQVDTYKPSGLISVSYNSVTYTRGNRGAVFDIPIEKDTVLAPFMVDEWFEGRNYNGREANVIIEDIKRYLLENKICKTVTIVSDEEYDTEDEEFLETED